MTTTIVVEQALARVDALLNSLAIPSNGRIPWSPQEEAILRRWYGRLSRPELAERVNIVLRQRTGNPQHGRTVEAVAQRAGQLGLEAYAGEADELHLRAAAQGAALSYETVWRAVKAGEMVTVRRGKQRYVTRRDFAVWLLAYRVRQEAQSEMLEALAGTETVSKKEAMILTGLGETHLTRYLQTGVIRAWKVPEGTQGRGYWRVERQAVVAFIAARSAGRLAQRLDGCPEYVTLRRQLTADIATLRQQKRLGRPDPLSHPRSRYHLGCFTVAQVASHLGLSTQAVYAAIARGEVQAEAVYRGGRLRYAINPAEARRYVTWMQSQTEQPASVYHNRCRHQIAGEGLLTVADLAKRWQVSPATIQRYSQDGYRGRILPSRFWGRYRVFDPGEVEAFEKVRAKRKGR